MSSPWGDQSAGKIGPGQPTMMDQATSMLLDQAGVPQAVQGMAALQQLRQGDWPNAANNAGLMATALAPMLIGGIRAFHGSPYDFLNFDASKIGTGQGAATYGRGIYAAEAERTAETYRDPSSTVYGPQGQAIGPAGYQTAAGLAAGIPQSRSAPDWLRNSVAQAWMRDPSKPIDPDSVLSYAYGPTWQDLLNRAPGTEDTVRGHIAETIKNAQPILDQYSVRKAGHMYETNIDASPDEFLDLDKRISEHPQQLQDKLADLAAAHGIKMGDVTGGRFYDEFAARYGDRTPQILQDAGIRGNRYLDAFSREKGEGTRNYVVFDPAKTNMDIVRKYMVPGLITGGLGAGAASQQ
jgi:hypothetical protein